LDLESSSTIVNHRDFEEMVLSLKGLLEKAEGQVVANLSGGPLEISLAFTIRLHFHLDQRFDRIEDYLNEPNERTPFQEKGTG
jgi:hypothetical protein